jgi:cell shape-determining protein MreC
MTTIKKEKNRIISALNLCLVMSVMLGGFFFLKSMDDVMVKNLELEQSKAKLELLREEKQDMESKKNSLESYESVSSRLKDLQMVKVADIEYISVGDDSLAKR